MTRWQYATPGRLAPRGLVRAPTASLLDKGFDGNPHDTLRDTLRMMNAY